ncbi:hypothetical protein K456DRAFT_859002 [Colletotrichum gloeosporioides 23]|nr:hypothetical protein K456DRAFT_859002 [Colletotrichum gloeosporioides 23]
MPVTPVICALCLPSFCASVLACTFSPSDWPVSCASPSPSQACLDLASRLSLSHPSLPHQGLSSRSTLFFFGGAPLAWLLSQFPPLPAGLTRTSLVLVLDKNSGRNHSASSKKARRRQEDPRLKEQTPQTLFSPTTRDDNHTSKQRQTAEYPSLINSNRDSTFAQHHHQPWPTPFCEPAVLPRLLSIGRHETAQSTTSLARLELDRLGPRFWGGSCHPFAPREPTSPSAEAAATIRDILRQYQGRLRPQRRLRRHQ